MPTIPNSYIPAPKSWEEFESIVLSAAKLRWQSDKFMEMVVVVSAKTALTSTVLLRMPKRSGCNARTPLTA